MRNEQQCLQRFMALERKKGPWAAEEDAALLARLHELSPGMADAAAADDPRSAAEGVRWSLVAAAVPGRTPGQARERWVGCLAPGSGVKRAWTAGEDEALSIAVRAQQDDDAAARGAAASARPRKFWVNVSRALPGRTSKQCDKRWQALHPKELEKRRRAAAIERKARAAPPRPPAEARRTCCRHRCFRKQERDMGARAADAPPPLCAGASCWRFVATPRQPGQLMVTRSTPWRVTGRSQADQTFGSFLSSRGKLSAVGDLKTSARLVISSRSSRPDVTCVVTSQAA